MQDARRAARPDGQHLNRGLRNGAIADGAARPTVRPGVCEKELGIEIRVGVRRDLQQRRGHGARAGVCVLHVEGLPAAGRKPAGHDEAGLEMMFPLGGEREGVRKRAAGRAFNNAHLVDIRWPLGQGQVQRQRGRRDEEGTGGRARHVVRADELDARALIEADAVHGDGGCLRLDQRAPETRAGAAHRAVGRDAGEKERPGIRAQVEQGRPREAIARHEDIECAAAGRAGEDDLLALAAGCGALVGVLTGGNGLEAGEKGERAGALAGEIQAQALAGVEMQGKVLRAIRAGEHAAAGRAVQGQLPVGDGQRAEGDRVVCLAGVAFHIRDVRANDEVVISRQHAGHERRSGSGIDLVGLQAIRVRDGGEANVANVPAVVLREIHRVRPTAEQRCAGVVAPGP